MIQEVFNRAFDEVEGFTYDLEKEKSSCALVAMKPVWRIIKSIQLRYCPNLDSDRMIRLGRMIDRLEIRDVTPTDFTEKEAAQIMQNFADSCGFRHENIPSTTVE